MKTFGEVRATETGGELVLFDDTSGDPQVIAHGKDSERLIISMVGASLDPARVAALRNHLDAWLRTGSLRVDETEGPSAYAVECPAKYAEHIGMEYVICYDVETAEGIANDISHETGETDARIVGLWPAWHTKEPTT